MKPFLFKFDVYPSPENPQGAGIGGAVATLCVFDTTMDAAKEKAIMIIQKYGWLTKGIDTVTELHPQQISDLDKQTLKLYRDAELMGFSCELYAWPETSSKGLYSAEPLVFPKKTP